MNFNENSDIFKHIDKVLKNFAHAVSHQTFLNFFRYLPWCSLIFSGMEILFPSPLIMGVGRGPRPPGIWNLTFTY